MKTMSRTITIAAVLMALASATAVTAAQAAVLCARRRPDGTFNGNVVIRQSCNPREVQLDAETLGLQGTPGPQGPAGPQGPPGPGFTSLDGLPCDTGNLDLPDGRMVTSLDDATGVMTIRCLSASTNPTFATALAPGPRFCTGDIIPFCFLVRFNVVEVDANGAPVPNGYTCGLEVPNNSLFDHLCPTHRFAPNTVVRLRATGGVGFSPMWTGCDSVSGDTCTATVTPDRIVRVLAQ